MDSHVLPGQNNTMTVGEWLITLLITAIPLVGLIMLFVWAFGGDTNPNKANWAKASLLMYAIVIVLMILFFSAFAAIIGGLMGSSSY